MQLKRARRLAPKYFQDYRLDFEVQGARHDARLGNLSESGLCFLIPGESMTGLEGQAARGQITGRGLSEPLAFEGRIVWAEQTMHNGEGHAIGGVQFHSALDLPDSLIAMGLSAESD